MSGEPAEFFPLILPLKSIIKQRHFFIFGFNFIIIIFFNLQSHFYVLQSTGESCCTHSKKRMLHQSSDPIIHPSFHLSIYSPTHPAPFTDGVFMKAVKLNFGDSTREFLTCINLFVLFLLILFSYFLLSLSSIPSPLRLSFFLIPLPPFTDLLLSHFCFLSSFCHCVLYFLPPPALYFLLYHFSFSCFFFLCPSILFFPLH